MCRHNLIKIKNEPALSFDRLVWTGPLPVLASLIWPQNELTRPLFVPTRLHHFLVNQNSCCDSHYIYMNAPDFLSFRVTLYSNITQSDDGRITVEAVTKGLDAETESLLVFDELKKAGILNPQATFSFVHSELLTAGFPEMTLALQRQNASLRDQLAQFESIIIGGRGAGDSFFMNDVLFDVGEQMKRVFGNPK